MIITMMPMTTSTAMRGRLELGVEIVMGKCRNPTNRGGVATGRFAVVADACRFVVMKLLAPRKVFAKNAPAPCALQRRGG
jgi:hypothetical protein